MSGVNIQNVHDRARSAPKTRTDSAISGQVAVTTAGTAVQGTEIDLINGVYIRALAANTCVVYVGNDGAGDVTSANGFELSAGDLVLLNVRNLSQLWFDAAVNGEGICWIKA